MHLETDSDVVQMSGGGTLTDLETALRTYRSVTVSGDATGTVSYRPAVAEDVNIIIDITDDSHGHTGSTVKLPEANKVVISGTNSTLGVSDVTADELGYLSGATSNLQSQINTLKENMSGIPMSPVAPTEGGEGDLWIEPIPDTEEA